MRARTGRHPAALDLVGRRADPAVRLGAAGRGAVRCRVALRRGRDVAASSIGDLLARRSPQRVHILALDQRPRAGEAHRRGGTGGVDRSPVRGRDQDHPGQVVIAARRAVWQIVRNRRLAQLLISPDDAAGLIPASPTLEGARPTRTSCVPCRSRCSVRCSTVSTSVPSTTSLRPRAPFRVVHCMLRHLMTAGTCAGAAG